ncbi:hypothetical protein ACOSP7_018210 [Xanthoceras sorbifolium]|uniref:Formin-like protein n=1 Tax=Xanthoceras sorbifolium TaxID=99658 RepID=A0ABQ8I0S5_9ROSI|nr:hypothetical protein JRO89_XS05G0068400 [Xanthoceras sorbifolium]
MADMLQPWLLLCLVFIFVLPFSSCQPQNIETFYPFDIQSPSPAPNSPTNPPTLTPRPPPGSPTPSQPPLLAPSGSSSSDNRETIIKAVVATAASTLVFAVLFFFVLQKYVIARRRREKVGNSPSPGSQPVVAPNPNNITRFDEDLKELIIDEDGLDVLYWRKLEEGDKKKSFNSPKHEEERDGMTNKSEAIQEIPLLRGKSSSSEINIPAEQGDSDPIIASKPPPPSATLRTIEEHEPATVVPSPPPPPPPPPPPTQNKKSPAPPAPPPIPVKKNPASPPPPPNTSGLTTSLKPPSGSNKGTSSAGESSAVGAGNGQVKLKPLHWDKVNKNVEHSMVWDKIDGGSFRFDGDLMEALFGYVATNKKSPTGDNNSKNPSSPNSGSSAQILILDPRKSQNSAIVLKSLALSRKELLNALTEGKGLNAETLEKLTKVAPTMEEQSQILRYDGDPTRLADAESFQYHLLKAIPSAYTRVNAMLFRSNYDSEILQLKESLQTLELGCRELRTRGLFVKLLEAVLKAGNRMNAGTARGNAQAFNLTALRKLSDVKSSDGKTTLLHFVVEEVVRAEGKRCVLNRNRSVSRSSSMSSNSSVTSENSMSKEEREKEYTMLGLPVVGGLSAEFSNVKKAATTDFDTFSGTSHALSARAAEIRELVSQCEGDGGRGGFVREMKSFFNIAEKELKALREEQTRVMELVKKTAEYYQAGAGKHEGALQLQLFVIIKDFLGMVDQVCVEIARNLQKRRASVGGSSPKSPALRSPVRFPNLPEHFLTDKSRSTSSESDSDS